MIVLVLSKCRARTFGIAILLTLIFLAVKFNADTASTDNSGQRSWFARVKERNEKEYSEVAPRLPIDGRDDHANAKNRDNDSLREIVVFS